MIKFTIALMKDGKHVVKKDHFNNDDYYGFWELGTEEELVESLRNGYLKNKCRELYDIGISDPEFITATSSLAMNYLFYKAEIEEGCLQDEKVEVTDIDLKGLNIIYPDAFCRDALIGEIKSKSQREKEILMAADKLFNISESAARVDAFIALMDNHIEADDFMEYMEKKKDAYRYGMPEFGFTGENEDKTLCIWKQDRPKCK
jgi:hypothetical protein